MTLAERERNRELIFKKYGRPKEYAAVETSDELILVAQWPDGYTEKTYERRKISDTEAEIITYPNRFAELIGGSTKTEKRIVKISG